MTEPEPTTEHWVVEYLASVDRVKRRKALRAVIDACRAAGLVERQRRREEQVRRRERERAERAS